MKDLIEKIEQAKEKYTFNKYTRNYMLSVQNYRDIVSSSATVFDGIENGFFCGFMQGRKAAIAEMKKKARAK